MYRVGLEFLTGFIRTPLPVHITSKLSHVAEPPVRVFMNREILTENLIDLLITRCKMWIFPVHHLKYRNRTLSSIPL